MKIIYFGGTGSMGQRTVTELCSFKEIEHITITARSKEKFDKLIAHIETGQEKLHFLQMDASSDVNLVDAIKGHDLVASSMGPFYRFEKKLAQAAVDAGADYVSICDDFDAAEQVYEVDSLARKKGLRVLTGIGWTPGISSLMARAGADSLDTVERINVAWAGNSDDSAGLAVILHVLHIFYGLVPSFAKSKLQMVPAGSGKEQISFPGSLGTINVYNVGHPEPVTMPRYFPGVEEVTLKGGINEDIFNKLSLIVAKLGLSKSQTARNILSSLLQQLLPLLRKTVKPGSDLSGIRVDISGAVAGKKHSISYSAAGPMDILTGVPMAIAIREMVRGNIKTTGVFAPEAEGSLDPQVIFAELEARNVQIIKVEE